MADVVNLRTARKQRERAEARRKVAVRTGDETERAKAEAALDRRRFDGHRRDGDTGSGGDEPRDGGGGQGEG
jgi:hypothetical protein